MEIDVWVPDIKLGFEYQGEQQYYDMSKVYGPSSMLQLYQNRDKMKKAICEFEKVHLVVVPYWWDGSFASLQGIIPPNFFNSTNNE